MVHFLLKTLYKENKISLNFVSDTRGFLDEAEKFETGPFDIVFSFETTANMFVYQSLLWNPTETMSAFPLGPGDSSD